MTRWQPTHCPVCRRLLLHRAGAAILLCPSCHSLLNLHAHPSTPGQTICLNCTNIIHHPIGPPLLHCRVCAATNPAPVRHYTCRVCSLYLACSSTLPAVFCPICHTVEPPIDSPASRIPVLLPLHHDAPPRPCPSLPPRRFPWLPSTPVRPVTTPRSPQYPRAPQQQLPIRLPSSSIPLLSGTMSQPYQSIHFIQTHQMPSSSAPSSSEVHQQQHYPPESHPQPSQTSESLQHPHSVSFNGDKLSINGGRNDNNSLDDSNRQAAQTSTLPSSSKSVKQEDVGEGADDND